MEQTAPRAMFDRGDRRLERSSAEPNNALTTTLARPERNPIEIESHRGDLPSTHSAVRQSNVA
jgi:hypothetical protein